MEWVKTAPFAGNVTLFIDGAKVDSTHIPFSHISSFSLEETFDVGQDTGTPVTWDYQTPFKFEGKIEKVVVEVGSY